MNARAKKDFEVNRSVKNRKFLYETGNIYPVISRVSDKMIKHPDGCLAIVSEEVFTEFFEIVD